MKKLEIAKTMISPYARAMIKNVPLEGLIELLPRQTYNCEPFGIKFMPTGETGKKTWSCCYFSHYSNKSDDRIPHITGASMKSAAIKMLKWFVKNMPQAIK